MTPRLSLALITAIVVIALSPPARAQCLQGELSGRYRWRVVIPEASETRRRLERLRELAGQPARYAQSLDRLLRGDAAASSSLTALEDGRFCELRARLIRDLEEAPALLAAMSSLRRAEAERLWRRALSGERAALESLVERWSPAPYRGRAALRWAGLELESGDRDAAMLLAREALAAGANKEAAEAILAARAERPGAEPLPAALTRAWRRPCSGSALGAHRLRRAGSAVLVSEGETLRAFAFDDGAPLWSVEGEGELTWQADERGAVLAKGPRLEARSLAGARRWSFDIRALLPELAEPELSGFSLSLILDGPRVIVAAVSRRPDPEFDSLFDRGQGAPPLCSVTLIGLDRSGGAARWLRHLVDLRGRGPADLRFARGGGRLFLGLGDGGLACLRGRDGRVDWLADLAAEAEDAPSGPLAAHGGAALEAAGPWLLLVDRRGATLRRRQRIDGGAAGVEWNTLSPFFIGIDRDAFVALSPEGALKRGVSWSEEGSLAAVEAKLLGSPVVADGRLFLPLADGVRAVCLDTDQRARLPWTSHQDRPRWIAVAGDALFARSAAGLSRWRLVAGRR